MSIEETRSPNTEKKNNNFQLSSSYYMVILKKKTYKIANSKAS